MFPFKNHKIEPDDYDKYWYNCAGCNARLHPAEQPYCETPGCQENLDEIPRCSTCGEITDLLDGLCYECTPEEE